MDKDKIALIVIIVVVIGGYLIVEMPWKAKGELPHKPWEKNEELTSKLQSEMEETGWTGIEIAVYEDTSESYPRAIRLYIKPTSPKGEWNIYDKGQVTRDGSIQNLDRPWKKEGPEPTVEGVLQTTGAPCFEGPCPTLLVCKVDDYYLRIEKGGYYHLSSNETNYVDKEVCVYGDKTHFIVDGHELNGIIVDDIELKQ